MSNGRDPGPTWLFVIHVVPSEETESTLVDSSGNCFVDRGTPMDPEIDNSGAVAWVSGLQQNVSRFHIRQLRFSNLRPSSIESAHLENTGVPGQKMIGLRVGKIFTCPHAK